MVSNFSNVAYRQHWSIMYINHIMLFYALEMRPKGLTQQEIQKICEFDWDDSADEDNGEEEEKITTNLENIIEETLQSVIERREGIEVGLIERIVGEDNEVENEIQGEETVQEVFENINLESLRWRSAEIGECDTT